MPTGGEFLTTRIGTQKVFSPDTFTDIHREFAQAGEEFALREIRPQQQRLEKFDKDLSLQLIKSCGELGFLGVDVPEKFGGLAGDKVTSAILVEKIARGGTESFTVTFFVHTGIGTLPIVYFGSEKQKQEILPRLVSGEWISAYALTEPGAGSDALSLQTHARLSEDGQTYLLNGSKQFISNGGWCDILITFAKINGEQLTGFLVDPKSPGVVIHEEKNKLGLHGSSTCNIILENVKVPAENVLGEIGKGADIAFNSLNIGRFKLGAAVLGGCKNVIEYCIAYGMGRRQFGQPIILFDALQKKIADMVILTFAMESIIYQTAHMLDEAIARVAVDAPDYPRQVANAIEKYAMECSICKVSGSESFWQITDEGLQILGGYGFIEDYPLARVLRDTRVDRIYEGTNEINRQIILGYLLKKTLLEELPVRDKIKQLTMATKTHREFSRKDLFYREKQAVESAKELLLFLFNQGLIRFGQDLLNQQQIGELFSDIISDIYILSTTVGRISQTPGNISENSILPAIGRVISAEKMLQIRRRARLILPGIFSSAELKGAETILRRLERGMALPTNTFALKKQIAETTIELKKYPFWY